MTTVYTVLADSQSAAEDELQRLCRALDLMPLGRPSLVLGRGRWLARAAAHPEARREQQSA